MKNIAILFVLLAAIIGSGCDHIEPPYKQQSGQVGTADRKVLLEDFTGHTCVNCPTAALIAHNLKTLYGDRLIVMAVHAGYFARPQSAPFDADYRSQAGEAWDQFFNISANGNPNALINRQKNNTYWHYPPGSWSTKVSEAMQSEAHAKIELNTSYEASTRKLGITAKTTFLTRLQGNFRLQVCLVEDSLVSAQRNNDPNAGTTPVISQYVHRHVLREAVNGIWGEQILSNPEAGYSATKSYQLNLPAGYNAQHCAVIVFVYDAETYEVLQVEEKHL
ncbi:MAG: Omp28 family outer membrane lipoprotein [Bacteroidetes bacterium]|nr:Omp28 family outer membrane lipoprotein [Bacteroidota bacterium]